MFHRTGVLFSVLIALCSVAVAATDTAQDYETALIELEQGNSIEAAIALKTGLQKDSRHVPSILLLGEIYLDNALWGASEAAFRRALTLGADPARVSPLLSRSLLAQHRGNDLLNELDPLAVDEDARAGIHALRGEAYLAQSDFAGLRAELSQAQAANLNTYTLRLLGVRLLLQDENLEAASQAIQQLIKEAPYRVETWNLAASVAHTLGEVDEALAHYTRAIEMEPGHGDARIGRMGLLVDAGRETEIGDDLDFFASNHPSEPRANYFRSLYLARQGDEVGARDALMQTVSVISQLHEVQLRGGNRTLLVLAALSHYGLGQFNAAAERAESYLTRDPLNVGVRKLLGDALIRADRPGRALTELQYAMELSPKDPALMILSATAMSDLRNFEGASSLLQRAIAIASLPDLEVRRANMEIGAGRVENGTRILRELLNDNPGFGTAGVGLIVTYMSNREDKRAIEVARNFLQSDPDNLAVRNLLGVAYINTNQTDLALREFRACIDIDPEFAPAAVNLSRVHRAQGELDTARAAIGTILERRPRSGDLLAELSQVEFAQGTVRDALATAELAYKFQPDSFAIASNYGELLLRAKEDVQGDRLTRNIVQKFSNAPEALDLRVRHLLAYGELTDARRTLKTLGRSAGSDLNWLLKTAAYQSDAGLLQDALESLAIALEYHPDSDRARLGLIELYLRVGRTDDATRVVEAAPAALVTDPAFVLLRGETRFAAGSLAAALGDFSSLQNTNQASIATVRQSHVLAHLGRLDDAEQVLRKFLLNQPADPRALEALADLLLATDSIAEAADVYRELTRERPDNARLQNNLAVALERLGEFESAIAAARHGHRLDPDNARYNDTLGWALYRDNQVDAALPYLREASVRDWANPSIRLHLVHCLKALGRHTEALKTLREGLDQSPSFAQQPEVMALLQDLSKRS